MQGRIVLALGLGSALAWLPVVSAAADDVLGTVGSRSIKRSEVEEKVKPKLVEIENERYEALKEGLDEIVAQELLTQEAKSRGVTVDALVQTEITAKVAEPTDADVQKVYDENKERVGGQTLEQIKPRIVQFLKQNKEAERRAAFIEELKRKYKTKVSLRPPKVEIGAAGNPERGGSKAAVTIVEFSDYQCPFCKRAEVVIDEVVKAYGDKVRVVFRDYPLEFHKDARKAHEAASCANAQGKFWEYHQKLFENQQALGEDKLKEYAKAVGLDQAKFDKCLADGQFKADVQKDIDDGAKVGVTGTPAFFINGRLISGAQPFEKFKEIIDEELANTS